MQSDVRFTPKSGHVRCDWDVRFVTIADIGRLIRSLVGAGGGVGGTMRPRRLRSLEIDRELEFGWLLNRNVGRFNINNATNIVTGLAKRRSKARSITYEAASRDENNKWWGAA